MTKSDSSGRIARYSSPLLLCTTLASGRADDVVVRDAATVRVEHGAGFEGDGVELALRPGQLSLVADPERPALAALRRWFAHRMPLSSVRADRKTSARSARPLPARVCQSV